MKFWKGVMALAVGALLATQGVPAEEAKAKCGAAMEEKDKPGAASGKTTAATKARPAGKRFARADANGDSTLQPSEFAKAFPRAALTDFEAADSNKDSKLTRKEAAVYLRERKGGEAPARQGEADKQGEKRKRLGKQVLKDADNDGDGQVTLSELLSAKPGFPEKAFKRADANGDGKLAAAEVQKAGSKKAQNKARQERLKAADKNSDQRLSWEEADAHLPRLTRGRFDALDTNKDGHLDASDRKKEQ